MTDTTDDRLLRVGELAKAVGKTVRAMHLYEELELLEPVSRSAGGYRLYARDAIERVSWIAKLQEMGFSLPEIRGFLRSFAGAASAPDAMARVRAVFESKLKETRDTLKRLRALERDLEASLGYLESCGSCNCGSANRSTGSCASCAQPGHDPAETPALVAGLRAQPPARPFDVPLTNLTGGNR